MKAVAGFHPQFIICTERGQGSEQLLFICMANDLLPFSIVWYESAPFSGFVRESGGEDKSD
jgi:hypothetical protein